jgi:hypothetical protein
LQIRTLFNINHQAEAIRETEKFYKENGVYEVVKKELLIRKFIAKKPLIMDKMCLDITKWRELFPESNDVWKELNFTFGNRILFKLAASPFYWIVPLIMKLK